MRNFWGYYCNGAYQVGTTGTLWVYDMEDQLIGRFRETPYSYQGAFVPGTNVFASHTNEGHLVFYDVEHMRLLKKIRTSLCGCAEDTGMAFSNDGKKLYCIQADWKDGLKRRLLVYDTETFGATAEYFANQDQYYLSDIEIERDGTCYISAAEQDERTRCLTRFFVGIFRDGQIAEQREYAEKWLTVCMYFTWKRHGFTKKSFDWHLRDLGFDFDAERAKGPSTLKKLYETGRL